MSPTSYQTAPPRISMITTGFPSVKLALPLFAKNSRVQSSISDCKNEPQHSKQHLFFHRGARRTRGHDAPRGGPLGFDFLERAISQCRGNRALAARSGN